MVDKKTMSRDNPFGKKALLCPNCRKLVSADEARCPYCGLSKPGSRLKNIFPGKGAFSDRRIIQTVIIVNVVMYLISLLISSRAWQFPVNPMSFLSPDSRALIVLGATGTIPIDRYQSWWSLVSASYLHGGLLHILFNMLALKQIAFFVLREYGTHRTIVIYALSGVFGFLISYLAGVALTIGASAAICGLIGSVLYFGKSRGGTYGQAIYRQVGGWAIGIFLFGILVPGINNWAHGGGMVAGIFSGWLMGYTEQKKEKPLHRLLAGICLLGTAFALLWAVSTVLYYQFQ